ncbi:MAG: DUF262 domain-containing protein [Fimbriimonadaceae bacterium]|nr:DUF262 domain-containing protein [Fimbriimonadaceae bacterium]
MKAVEANLLKFLQNPKQFVIPIYQRTYDWRLDQCQQLWRDIVAVGRDGNAKGHFVGSIVYIARGLYNQSSVPQLLVIDGQQRLTTLTLLLTALGRAIDTRNADAGISRRKLENYFLFNSEEDGDLLFKLLLTQSDRETLTRIVEDRELPEKPSHRIVENHRFFAEQLAKSSTDLETVYEGLQKLIIVDIALDRDHDNPQLIFESLNATGLKLSQADLIRNYVFMGLEPKEQSRLYEDHWFPMEQAFGQADYAERFDPFMRDYLTVRTGRIPNLRDIYADFKTHAQTVSGEDAMESIASDLHGFSRLYVRVVLGKEPDTDLKAAFDDINRLRVDVAAPFLIEVYEDHEAGRLSRADFLRVLRLVESYVFRRAVCGIPTNSLNKTFAGLVREIDKERYLPSLEAALALKDGFRRFPRDEEFKSALMVRDVYNFRVRNYMLDKLENEGRKERASVESYTIEHILPQNENLRPEWREALGENWKEAHGRLLHTLGNLTLTGYNSEYSDRPFKEKRDMEGGFAQSPLRLNEGLGQLDRWDEEQIVKRARRLSDKAASVWPAPELPASMLVEAKTKSASDHGESYAVEGHSGYLYGEMLELFEELRKRVMNLDASVRMEVRKIYIAFKLDTNFVDVIPQKKRLVLILNMPFTEVDDPKGMCRDISGIGKWGNGDVEASISGHAEIEDAMHLIRQAYERQAIEAEGG